MLFWLSILEKILLLLSRDHNAVKVASLLKNSVPSRQLTSFNWSLSILALSFLAGRASYFVSVFWPAGTDSCSLVTAETESVSWQNSKRFSCLLFCYDTDSVSAVTRERESVPVIMITENSQKSFVKATCLLIEEWRQLSSGNRIFEKRDCGLPL